MALAIGFPEDSMKKHLLPVLALVLAAPCLQAQSPRFGVALNLAFPTGEFRNKTYPANADITVPQQEGYDVGLGGQFTISFPLDPGIAMRLNFSGQSINGTNTAPPYEKINLQHTIFSVGGEFQFFLNGNAWRHRGTYLLLGPSADFERFDRSRYDDVDTNPEYTERKSRLGGTIGIGHSFGIEAARFNLEVAFHKTLSGNDMAKGEPPSSDFVKVSLGWVF
ncbi:MAG: hypothetical protein IPL96_08610 [Holophagaceae bacterium]|nr:hypothetical protein [Holophagaceae bacterium]